MTHLNSCLCWKLCVLGVLLSGCLSPLAESGDLYSSYILAPGTVVPMLESDKAAGKKLDANDGLSGMSVPLHSAFAGGSEVQYWDFGPLTALTAKPMWIFRRRAAGDAPAVEVDHPNLIDSIPGDTVYTPLRQIFTVFVTNKYRGEKITTLRALEDAVEIGLLEAAEPQDRFVNCPVTLSTMQLEEPNEGESSEPQAAYYHGRTVSQFCIGGLVAMYGAFALKDGAVSSGNAYLLRRENEGQPLDEALLKAKLNDDEDMLDTNTIYDSNVGDASYMSVWHNVEVVVPSDYKYQDAKSEDDLFVKKGSLLTGKPGKVVQYKDSGVFLNRPIKQQAAP